MCKACIWQFLDAVLSEIIEQLMDDHLIKTDFDDFFVAGWKRWILYRVADRMRSKVVHYLGDLLLEPINSRNISLK